MEILNDQLNVIIEITEKIKRHQNVDSHTEIVYADIIAGLNKELTRLNQINHIHQDILNSPINQINELIINAHALNVFNDLHVKSLGDLLTYPKADIQNSEKLSTQSINDISDFIKSLGIEWK